MNRIRKKLLSDLQKIAVHFKLKLSRVDVVRKTALALDSLNKKLLVMDAKDHPYFKTIDLHNINACTLKVDYKSIAAGELNDRNMDDFIDRVQLQISHIEPDKSVDIGFYDTKDNNADDLRSLVAKATDWRDKISSMLPVKLQVRA